MKLKKKLIQFAVALLVFATSCAGMDGENDHSMSPTETSGAEGYYTDMEPKYNKMETETSEDNNSDLENSSQNSDALDNQMVLDRKLIKNATLSFKTDSLSLRKQIVDSAVRQFFAYVEHEEQFATYDRENVTTTIRVPTKNFDPFMDAITRGVGSFDSKTIQMDDVTEEYVDVAARIHTKKELKARFIKLLDKAGTIVKIMEVEREITALQAEIESFEGRLKYLSGSVKYATVHITYYRLIEVPIEFENKFESAFSNGWQGLVWFGVGLVSVWPFLVVIMIVLTILRIKLVRKKVSK